MQSCIAILFIQLSICAAAIYDHHEALGMACGIAAQELFTTCNQEDYDCFCNSSLYIYAVETCIGRETHYNSTLMGMAFDKFESKFCETHNAHANTTHAWSVENQRLNPTVTDKAYHLAYQAEKNNLSQKRQSLWLGVGLLLYWAIIFTLIFLGKIIKRIFMRLFTYRMVMRRTSGLERWLQKYVIWPALFNSKHMSQYQFFRGWIVFSLPSRFQSAIVSGYILLAIIFMLTPYTFMNNDPLFSSRWKEMMRYSSDRSGILATVQLPMLFLFAMRNNVLQWLCGWSYSTFNAYHRAVARVTYALLVVHAVTKHIFSVSYHGSMVKYYYPVPYFRWGCSAIGLFSLMIMSAVMRGRGYELFYRMHQLMAIGGIICSIFHLRGLSFQAPLYISLVFLGADWTIRIGRILLFNVNIIMPPIPGAYRCSYATARVYDGEMVRLTVTTPVRWVAKPGQYVFLHMSRWSFIGGHPFSVVSASENGDGVELLIKARRGATRKLHDALDDRSCSPKYPVTIPVYIEGPYGNSVPVERYEEGLFFAGGVGITGIIGYLNAMYESSISSKIPKKVRLFWSIRSCSDIEPVIDQIIKLRKTNGVYIRIFQRHNTIRPVSTVRHLPDTFIDNTNEIALPKWPNGDNIEKGKNNDMLVHVELDHLRLSSTFEGENDNDTMISPPSSKSMKRITQDKPSAVANEYIFPKKYPRNSRNNHLSWQPKKYDRSISIDNQSNLHHFRSHSDIPHTVASFVKSKNPEDDETFDYGKKKFLSRSSSIYNHEKNTSFEDVLDFQTNRHQKDQMFKRPNFSGFIEAGFTDTFPGRPRSILNPFEDHLYPFDNVIDNANSMNEKVRENEEAEIYKMIEPTGMDVTSIVKHHFKHLHGSTCVVGCGPDRMMDTLCWSCCEFLEFAKGSRVDYYEEAFKW